MTIQKEIIQKKLEELTELSSKEIKKIIETDIEYLKVEINNDYLHSNSRDFYDNYEELYEIIILKSYLEYALSHLEFVQYILEGFLSNESSLSEKQKLLHSEFLKPYLPMNSFKVTK